MNVKGILAMVGITTAILLVVTNIVLRAAELAQYKPTHILLCPGMTTPINVYGNDIEVNGAYLHVRVKKDGDRMWIGPNCFITGKVEE